jgi:PII-like signaling protein
MEPLTNAKVMRIFVSSTDKYKHEPMYEAIVYAAKRFGLAGATVLKGVMGYGASSNVTTVKLFELSEKLPLVIEIVDTTEKIERFSEIVKSFFDEVRYGGLVTIEDARIILYKKGSSKG